MILKKSIVEIIKFSQPIVILKTSNHTFQSRSYELKHNFIISKMIDRSTVVSANRLDLRLSQNREVQLFILDLSRSRKNDRLVE